MWYILVGIEFVIGMEKNNISNYLQIRYLYLKDLNF